MVKRVIPASLRPGTETVRIANNQVSPKRNITPLMLNSKRTMVFFSTGFFLRAAVSLTCRTRTTMTQTKMTMLKIMTAKIGTRKAPQKAPRWERKHLQQTIIIIHHLVA